MQAVRHRQTTAPLCKGVLRLPVSGDHIPHTGNMVVSPYFQVKVRENSADPRPQRKVGTGRDTNLSLKSMRAVVKNVYPAVGGAAPTLATIEYLNGNTPFDEHPIVISFANVFTVEDLKNECITKVNADVASDPTSLDVTDGITLAFPIAEVVPMFVSGVAKTGTFAVTGAPSVAGGAGVARFYIDSNGDGTGTAPSEVYTDSLQAVVWNSANVYIPSAVSVDASKEYIDVTLKQQAFSGITVVGINVLGSAALNNAPNGTTVRCFVIVKK